MVAPPKYKIFSDLSLSCFLFASSENYIAMAVLRLVEEEKCVVEGAGATGVAAAIAGLFPELQGKRYSCICNFITVKAEKAYHLSFQYSNQNRIFIKFGFPCVIKSLNIFAHCGFQKKKHLL